MKKISLSAQLAAYSASILLGFSTFAAYNFLSVPEDAQTPEIPVINLASLELNPATSIAHAASGNPFGVIPEAAPDTAATGMGMPQGITPPTPPGVPAMPQGAPGGEVVVLGVLPPDVVIISRGGKSITARSGQDTEFGSIGSVTMSGAYIDGTFISQK